MRHTIRSLALTSVTLSTLVAAQEFEVAYLVPASGGGLGTSNPVVDVRGADVDSLGNWHTTVRFDPQTVLSLGDEFLLAGDGVVVREGDLLTAPPTERVRQIGPVSPTEDNTTLSRLELASGKDCIAINASGAFLTGDLVSSQGVGINATWLEFRAPESARDPLFVRALLRGRVQDPGGVPAVKEVLTHVILSGTFTGLPIMVAHEGMHLPSLGRTVASISTDRYAADIAGHGAVLWIGSLAATPSASDDVVMLGGQQLLREGDPAPAFFTAWGDFSNSAVTLNSAGDWALRSHVVGLAGNRDVVVVNGSVLAMEGAGLPDIAPAVFAPNAGPTFGTARVELDEGGRALWFGRFGTPSTGGAVHAIRGGLFVDEQLIAMEGSTVIGGRVLDAIDGTEGSYALAPGGGHVAFTGVLGAPGTPERALIVTRVPLGAEYCPNVANSTGVPARLAAYGSFYALQNSFRLEARALPPGAIAMFLIGSAQVSIAGPAGSQGVLCVGGSVGRFSHLLGAATGGRYERDIDLTSVPQPSGPLAVVAGSTWCFQCWYRDANPQVTTNFSSAVRVPFF